MAEEIKEMAKKESESETVKQHSVENQDSDEFSEENQEGKDMEVKNKEEQEMQPWEQHSAVISIPRFDYNAPSSLLQHSHSGFLITCPIKREKSATKEAMSIFEKFIGHSANANNGTFESLDATVSAKRRKIGENRDKDLVKSSDNKDATDECGATEKYVLVPLDSNSRTQTSTALSLVKLTRSGLLLLVFPRDRDPNVVATVSNIFQSLASRSLKSPEWCHRIFPIQTTCCLDEKEIQTSVTKLVNQFITDNRNKVSRPVKFAVGYNRRGIEETELKDKKSNGSNLSIMLDRRKCFEVVATAVKDVIPNSVVDLKSPELSVLLEVLPLSGMPENKVVVAVSVLPQELISAKPRLGVRALALDGNKNEQKI